MDDVFIQNALAYAAQSDLELAARLGFGVHGIIFVGRNKSEGGKTAVKVHRELEPYLRERAVYERLIAEGLPRFLTSMFLNSFGLMTICVLLR